MNPRFIIIIVVALAIVGGIGFWYWQSNKSAREEMSPQQEATSQQPQSQQSGQAGEKATVGQQTTITNGFGAQVLDQTQNPIKEKLPETNPFSDTETNPLKRVIRNPF